MGASYHYESAKDELKWSGVSVKDHIGVVMSVGNLVTLDKKAFSEAGIGKKRAMTADDLDKLARMRDG